jgi:hypothetical protein
MAYKIQHLGLGGILDQAIAILRDHFGLLFAIVTILVVPCELIIGAIDLANSPPIPPDASWLEAFEAEQNYDPIPGLSVASAMFELFLNLVMLPLANAAVIHAVARLYLGQSVTAWEAIGRAFQRFWPLMGTSILMLMAIFGGLILLVVPGILFALWFSLSQHVVVIEDMAGAAALRRSKKLVRPHLGTSLALGLIMLTITLLVIVGAMFIPQPHVQVVGVALASALTTLVWTAAGVVFYFSCRCAEENFDLHYLAEAIGASPTDEQMQPALP